MKITYSCIFSNKIEFLTKVHIIYIFSVKCPEFFVGRGHGVVSYSNLRYVDSIATTKCNPGYKLIGQQTLTCRVDGTWNQSTPRCDLSN